MSITIILMLATYLFFRASVWGRNDAVDPFKSAILTRDPKMCKRSKEEKEYDCKDEQRERYIIA